MGIDALPPELEIWNQKFDDYWHDRERAALQTDPSHFDPAHDLLHLRRVVQWAIRLAVASSADLWVVLPAAWFHDLVSYPKNHPLRAESSKHSASAAIQLLHSWNYPPNFFPLVLHAIEAHSYSADLRALTLEAQIVQDADRLDAIGAIGIARVFATGTQMGRPFYRLPDPTAQERLPDDSLWTVDHFAKKLLLLRDRMHTEGARAEAARRHAFMQDYLTELKRELEGTSSERSKEVLEH